MGLTIQSCMILFQSSPVTIRKSRTTAFNAVWKLACLKIQQKEVSMIHFYAKHVKYTLNITQIWGSRLSDYATQIIHNKNETRT